MSHMLYSRLELTAASPHDEVSTDRFASAFPWSSPSSFKRAKKPQPTRPGEEDAVGERQGHTDVR